MASFANLGIEMDKMKLVTDNKIKVVNEWKVNIYDRDGNLISDRKMPLYCYAEDYSYKLGVDFYVLERGAMGILCLGLKLQKIADELKILQEDEKQSYERNGSITGMGLYHLIYEVAPKRWERTDKARCERERRDMEEGKPFARSLISEELLTALRGPENIPRALTKSEHLELERLIGRREFGVI